MLRRTVPHMSSASNSLHSGTGCRVMVRLLPTARIRPLSTSKMTVLVFVVPTSMPTRYIFDTPSYTHVHLLDAALVALTRYHVGIHSLMRIIAVYRWSLSAFVHNAQRVIHTGSIGNVSR